MRERIDVAGILISHGRLDAMGLRMWITIIAWSDLEKGAFSESDILRRAGKFFWSADICDFQFSGSL